MDLDRITKRDTSEGVWIKPDPFEEIEFRARGFTPAFFQKQSAAIARLGRKWQGWDNVPHNLRERCDVDALFEECILDVRNVTLSGKPATVADVHARCKEDRGAPALALARAAVQRADNMRAADAEEAAGNSAPSSNGMPSGDMPLSSSHG